MELDRPQQHAFRGMLWEQYRLHGRPDLPWRQPERDGRFDPYQILVSELMLQQTQVSRVIPKYQAFMQFFPDLSALAAASLGDILRAWQGLGYNRRAKFLWQSAQILAGLAEFPRTIGELTTLPGIGANTAGAVLTYSFNQPEIFIETNVRTVYLHHFFPQQTGIGDKEILALVSQTVKPDNPREFYWALMDYGSWLKTTVDTVNMASRHYRKQSRFQGSSRQIRGQVIRLLGVQPYSARQLAIVITDERLPEVLQELRREALITKNKGLYSL